jgi:hypothetical protein
MRNVKYLCVLSALGVAACGGGSSAVNNAPTLQVGQQVPNAAGLLITVERVYDNGAVVGSFENDGVSGVSYRSDPTDIETEIGSTSSDPIDQGDRTDFLVTSVSEETGFNRTGTRYFLRLEDGFAATQIKRDVAGENLDLSYFGTPTTTMPVGTITYGAASDNAAFLHIGDQTIELPFSFIADLENGTASFTATDGSYQIIGEAISIDASTGEFYGTGAQAGAVGALFDANVSGSLYGTNASGVAGMIYSTGSAIPSVTGNFVGSRDTVE